MPDCDFISPLIAGPCTLTEIVELQVICPSPPLTKALLVSGIHAPRGIVGCAGGTGATGPNGISGIAIQGAPGSPGGPGGPGRRGKDGCAAGSGVCAQAIFS